MDSWNKPLNGMQSQIQLSGKRATCTTGPIAYATYMQTCLSHPTEGYYMNPTHAILGSKGDFITSPEISQVFGEIVAVWLLSQWMNFGRSRKIRLVELGPGRGTLMADILRVFSHFPAARSAVRDIHLVETSLALRKIQDEKLGPMTKANGWNCMWHDGLDDLSPDEAAFTMVLAHEFFDALPFHLLKKTEKGWHEILIASGPDPTTPQRLKASTSRDIASDNVDVSFETSPRFRQVLSETPNVVSHLLAASSSRFQKLPIGSHLEVSPAAYKVARKIGEILHSKKGGLGDVLGCALVVDYGGDHSFGSSFRAFKDHKIVDVFYRPGECDLTTNVDFAYLKDAIADLAITHGPLTQETFLTRMGLQLRVDALKKSASSEARKADIEAAAKRLIDPLGMGRQYQFLGITGTRNIQPTPEQCWPFIEDTSDHVAERDISKDSLKLITQVLAYPALTFSIISMSNNKKLIFVVGATGAQGLAVIDALLAPYPDGSPSPYSVRALTRDLGHRRAQLLASKGVECVQGSTDDLESVASAMEGAYGTWINTDGFTIGEQKEIYAGMRIFEIAKQVGSVRHYVWSSLDYALKLGNYNPKYRCEHYDGKARVAEWMKAQPSHDNEDDMAWSVVTSGPYMDMLYNLMFGPLNRRSDGTYVFAAPLGSGRVPMIALSDLGFFARYTFDHRSMTSGKELAIASQMVTLEDIASTFRQVTGNKAVAVDRSIDLWFDLFGGVDNPVANEKPVGGGSTTWKENFRGWWALWRDGMVQRDMDWIRSINPEGHTLESWMKEVNYDGQLQRSVLKNVEDSKTIVPIRELLVEL
ncbi:hypothetical protein NM688_g5227 [Phlebia brevispora]|uniref:Uncharacterized protein n=1 Tax=Phlebia brevispora TaxID=194682 RepID=A0ACC1SYP6_9APHY|nr:hypothetical protein NM688_g5227 [Phlebia brevispora]